MRLKSKDLLGLEYLTKEEIELILDTAVPFEELFTRSIKKVPTLRGKSVVLLFYEPSTRTRTSFELAAKRLSADTVNVAVATSSVKKGESLIDHDKKTWTITDGKLVDEEGNEESSDNPYTSYDDYEIKGDITTGFQYFDPYTENWIDITNGDENPINPDEIFYNGNWIDKPDTNEILEIDGEWKKWTGTEFIIPEEGDTHPTEDKIWEIKKQTLYNIEGEWLPASGAANKLRSLGRAPDPSGYEQRDEIISEGWAEKPKTTTEKVSEMMTNPDIDYELSIDDYIKLSSSSREALDTDVGTRTRPKTLEQIGDLVNSREMSGQDYSFNVTADGLRLYDTTGGHVDLTPGQYIYVPKTLTYRYINWDTAGAPLSPSLLNQSFDTAEPGLYYVESYDTTSEGFKGSGFKLTKVTE